jgi:uridine kinase
MFSAIREIAHRVAAHAERPCLVGIDGRSGAGKSSLARTLSEQLADVVVIHTDDFYRVMNESVRASLDARQGYFQYFDWNRLERQVLCPLAAGQPARYERYDWVKEQLAETIEIAPQGIILVEGVASTRPELRTYYDLRIWVETSDGERMRRQIARGENSPEWIDRWAAAEAFYVEQFRPRQSAHLIVAGE